MCRLIRKYQPHATIVVGGHVANVPDLRQWVDADHVVRGDGVRWMRRFLGEDENQPIRHPQVLTEPWPRIMGTPLRAIAGLDYATLIPAVGCPMGCNFCSTSAMFGGKGKFIEFYKTGDELFEIMCALESNLHVRGFFVMDENFLLDRKRALQLLDLMEQHGKSVVPAGLQLGQRAAALQHGTTGRPGVNWVWLGLEGKDSQYAKLAGTDTMAADPPSCSRTESACSARASSAWKSTRRKTSTKRSTMPSAITRTSTSSCSIRPCRARPCTPSMRPRARCSGEPSSSMADIHGQLKFNFRHPHIHNGEEGEFLLRAFQRDFEVNGPSVVRIIRTLLRGWQRYKDHANPRIRARFAHEASNLPVNYAGASGRPAAIPRRPALPATDSQSARRAVCRVRPDGPPGRPDRRPPALPRAAARGTSLAARLDL